MAMGLLICIGFVILVLVLLAAFYAISIFNGLVTLRNSIDKAWANIDVVLKERSDLIPNLVECVRGYKDYEKGVLEDVTRLRASMMSAQSPARRPRPATPSAQGSRRSSRSPRTIPS